jgi:hypothetical protein
VSISQNDGFSFSFLYDTYTGLAQLGLSTPLTLGPADRTRSTFVFWYIQRYWKISTKKIFVVTNVVTVLIPLLDTGAEGRGLCAYAQHDSSR